MCDGGSQNVDLCRHEGSSCHSQEGAYDWDENSFNGLSKSLHVLNLTWRVLLEMSCPPAEQSRTKSRKMHTVLFLVQILAWSSVEEADHHLF